MSFAIPASGAVDTVEVRCGKKTFAELKVPLRPPNSLAFGAAPRPVRTAWTTSGWRARKSGGGWTRADDYVAALARRRTARKSRQANPRDQHEAPRFPVGMVPFVALMIVFAVLAIATIIIAFPGRQPQPKPKQFAAHEQGYAPKGWLQEAQKEFH